MSKPTLRALREQKGLSLTAMAALCGVDKSYLSKLERGIGADSIEVERLKRIEKNYGRRLRIPQRRRLV